jgi:hypothetical protein
VRRKASDPADRQPAERLRQGWRSPDFRAERERAARKVRIKPDLSIMRVVEEIQVIN